MNGLLSMIGMQTELEYQMGDNFPFGSPRIRFNVPKGNIPSDKQKCQPKEQLTDKNGIPIYEGDIVMHKDNNAERRGDINWDSKAAAFCFGQDFLFYYSSEDMVVVGNKYDK